MSRIMDERLMKYIPKKIQPHIIECESDSDGYWAICETGWHFVSTGCHTAHGYTIAEFRSDVARLVQVEDDWD